MMVPIILRSSEEFLRTVPRSLREGAMAVGASKWKTIATVVVPAASGGILTAILLSLSRVAGETAPLLFTALGNQFWSHGWNEPTASLPLVIYTYAHFSLRRLAPAGVGGGIGVAGLGAGDKFALPGAALAPGDAAEVE